MWPISWFDAPVSSSIFEDAFDDSSFDISKWTRRHSDSNVALNETTHLQMLTTAGSSVNEAIDSIPIFDFTGRTFDVFFDLNLGIVSYFLVGGLITDPISNDNVNRVNWVMDFGGGGTEMLSQYRVSGTNHNGSAYLWSSGVMNYLRIRHDAGTDNLYFERSSNGISWTIDTTVAAFSTLMSLTNMHAFLWIVGGPDGSARDGIWKNLKVS